MKSQRPKVEPVRNPTLFPMDKLEEEGKLTNALTDDRPYSLPGILLGTSSFTAKGWEGVFYPQGMRSHDFLSYYAKQFRTVEIDSTFYGTPRASTVTNWRERTPSDFVFAVKVPQIVTHEKILVGCEPEFDEFVETVALLGDKLGPMLFQFPKFDKWMLKNAEEFLARMDSFFKRITNPALRFVVEIRNKNWLDARLTDFLRERNVALALTDTSFMPRPWEMKESLDLVTSDFVYVRWLGNRKGIEEQTTTWNKTVVDRTQDLKNWARILNELVLNKNIRKLFAFANNHYAGHAPNTVREFESLWTPK